MVQAFCYSFRISCLQRFLRFFLPALVLFIRATVDGTNRNADYCFGLPACLCMYHTTLLIRARLPDGCCRPCAIEGVHLARESQEARALFVAPRDHNRVTLIFFVFLLLAFVVCFAGLRISLFFLLFFFHVSGWDWRKPHPVGYGPVVHYTNRWKELQGEKKHV